MSTIQDLFQQAQLAEAAYANFFDDAGNLITTESQLKTALTTGDGKFSQAQATDFVLHWRVVSQQPNTSSGFSATVFESLDHPGTYSYAVRGTEPLFANPADLLSADARGVFLDGIALDQVVDMYNDWQRLTHLGAYQAMTLETQLVETAAYKLAQAGLFVLAFNMTASAYLNWINSRTDIVIDQPLGLIRKITPILSTDLFTDNRQFGSNALAGQTVEVAGHSLGGHLARNLRDRPRFNFRTPPTPPVPPSSYLFR